MEKLIRKFVYRCGQFFENKRRSGTTSFLKKLSDENQGKIWVLCPTQKEASKFGENGLGAEKITEYGNFIEDRPILVDNHFLLMLCEQWRLDMGEGDYKMAKNAAFLQQLQFMINDFQNGKMHPLEDKDFQRRLERSTGNFRDFNFTKTIYDSINKEKL
jgi:hypothetical protein